MSKHCTAMSKSKVNFDRTIAGFNVTEHGIRSYSKSFKLGPFQFTANVKDGKVRGSMAIPGTGISFRNALEMELPSLETPDLPEYKKKKDMW
jgi:hypothetical protein